MDPARQLARRAAAAARRPGALRTLLLDVDGTLAPIAPTPEAARVPPSTLEALHALVGLGWTVALVSGRPAREVRAMVPISGVRIFGSHGLEGSWSRSGKAAVAPATKRRLARLARDAARLSDGLPGVLIERKPAGVALHDRKLTPRNRAEWGRRVREWLAEVDLGGLELLRGRRVLEIRPRGAHKGRVAETMPRLRGSRPRDASLIAIGDDVTDEDLFRAVGKNGVSVRVGRAGKRSAATLRLASPAAVGRFLKCLTSWSFGRLTREDGGRRRKE
jgi:trehalose-phosphatase